MADKLLLIVEDDPSSSSAMKILLSKHGWRVTTAMSLSEAMVSIQTATPDAVVLDLMLPDGDGTMLLEFLRRNHPKTRVVITTGVLDSDWLERAEALKPAGILKKPIWIDDLLKHLLTA